MSFAIKRSLYDLTILIQYVAYLLILLASVSYKRVLKELNIRFHNFMPKPDHVLSFATDKDGSQLFIHADAKGLERLIRSLTHIHAKLRDDICEHDHLMTDAWAGSELSERSMSDGVHTIHHVKIYGWTQEWISKHGLGNDATKPPVA